MKRCPRSVNIGSIQSTSGGQIMRLEEQGESQNIEDRRGGDGGIGRGSIGIGTLLVALAAGYFFGVDPALILGLASSGSHSPAAPRPAPKPPANDEMARFVAKVLGSTEATWRSIFDAAGRRYQEPKLVLFTGATPTACGTGRSAMGPFYCPSDQQGLYRPGVLPRSTGTLPRPRRIRAGLCDRSRSRSSRAEPARHLRQGARGATA
jgi:hypothetical protein